MAWSLRKAFGIEDSPFVGKNEIVPGTDKPSIILAGMVTTRILKKISEITFADHGRTHSFQFTDDRVTVTWQWSWADSDNINNYNKGRLADLGITFNQNRFSFNETEKQVIRKGLVNAMKLRLDFSKNQKEHDRQQKAVNLIDEFFKVKPLPVPVPESQDLIPGPVTTELEELAMAETPAARGRGRKLSVAA